MFISLDSSIPCFWLWRRRQVACTWCLHHSWDGCIHCHSGGCVLGCSVRQQGMAPNNQNSGHNSVWAGIPTLGWIILWNTLVPTGAAPRTSSAFSKARPAEGNASRHETRSVGRHSCPITTSTEQAKRASSAGRHVGHWGLAPDGGAGSGRTYWGAGKMEALNHSSSAIPFSIVSLSFHSLGVRGLSWGYRLYIFILRAGEKN